VIQTNMKNLPWLKSSFIGRMQLDFSFKQVNDVFCKGGMSMINVRYIGDNLVLLT